MEIDIRTPRLYVSTPSCGMVIGTFASVPYIHLQLEARKRYYPHVPCLVHDDCSGRQEELRELCCNYGVDFEVSGRRQPPYLGDVSTFICGLGWAQSRGLDLLLKVSRRWIFLADWTPSLIDLSVASQYATLGSYTTTYNFGFRSECLALSVAAWSQPLILSDLLQPLRDQQEVFVESFLHGLAQRLERVQCEQAEWWRWKHPVPPECSGYALWEFMGTDRCEPAKNHIWHDSHSPIFYRKTAMELGILRYSQADFNDPNQGETPWRRGDPLQDDRLRLDDLVHPVNRGGLWSW
jgi:hypothetical protein